MRRSGPARGPGHLDLASGDPAIGLVGAVGVGEDFEYRTSDQTFLAARCPGCGLVYLDPRPADHETSAICPDSSGGDSLPSRRSSGPPDGADAGTRVSG